MKKLLASLGAGQPTSGSQPAAGGGGGISGQSTPSINITPKFGDGGNSATVATGSGLNAGTGTPPGPATVAAPLGAGIATAPQEPTGIPPAVTGQGAAPTPENPAASQPVPFSPAEAIALALQVPPMLAEPIHGIAELPAFRPYPLVTDGAAPLAGPDASDHLYAAGNPMPAGPVFRMGYADFLRSDSSAEVMAVAVTGVTGIIALTGFGGLIGYRQARAGRTGRAVAVARFLN